MDWIGQGPLTTAMARQRGASRVSIEQALADGRVVRVARGLLMPKALVNDIPARAAALGLVLPSGVIVCDRSASYLHGIDAYRGLDDIYRGVIDCVVPPGTARPRAGAVNGGVRAIPDDHITTIHGLRVTTAARTAVDLACGLGPFGALATVEQFLHRELVTKSELLRVLARFAGRRGVRQARTVIGIADPLVESTGESFCRMAIVGWDLPVPVAQHVVPRPNGGTYVLDNAYPHLLIAVEYDGEEFHGPDRDAHDQQRRAWLKSQGWLVIVVRKADLSGLARERWLRRLDEAITEREVEQRRRGALARR
ncbi:DUF559 domain-containing protein [Calidifontibacter sp. DB0510]|uniref:DUF559 domain-containing protein n=1 Tax=Metallococcus carri TaxID=1656884 RepID=A0A967EFW3_9MICO|nr:type IV toxin-antitoxin system AbiEi family antitoxin domain-containing protein [Metallococcus carri]NHN57001.1 DUF559 domain-containing protein [Metallococcus carri]NOP37746.1 DUF559 domain-containing protein [Calidifontibacter sp. DB2511S]